MSCESIFDFKFLFALAVRLFIAVERDWCPPNHTWGLAVSLVQTGIWDTVTGNNGYGGEFAALYRQKRSSPIRSGCLCVSAHRPQFEGTSSYCIRAEWTEDSATKQSLADVFGAGLMAKNCLSNCGNHEGELLYTVRDFLPMPTMKRLPLSAVRQVGLETSNETCAGAPGRSGSPICVMN